MIKRTLFYILMYYTVVCSYGCGTRVFYYPNLDIGWVLTGKGSRS